MRRGDLLVAIASRRRTKQFKLVMKHAKALGLKIILIEDLHEAFGFFGPVPVKPGKTT